MGHVNVETILGWHAALIQVFHIVWMERVPAPKPSDRLKEGTEQLKDLVN